MMDVIAQIGVFTSGVMALWLVGSTNPRKRMQAGIFGLMSEPCWLYTTISNEQWGIVPLVLIYCYTWWRVYSNNKAALNWAEI